MRIIQNLKQILLNSSRSLTNMAAQPVDIRAIKAIDHLSQLLLKGGQPFSILDLGCSGGPTNAWTANWSNYKWLGIDAEPNSIIRLRSLLPEKSELQEGYVYSEKFCQHEQPNKGSRLEIGEILKSNSFDFVKIDIDGCDLHILEGIFDNAGSKSILGIEIEVTYSSYRDSEINFDRCASVLIANGFEPVAIESARRYASKELPSPYVWDIEAQTAMGKVFQGNQTWLRKLPGSDPRSPIVSALILAAYGLSDWSWQYYKDSIIDSPSMNNNKVLLELRSLFIPSFLREFTSETYDREYLRGFKYSAEFESWRQQSQFRETEQPWFLSN
jgi:hypothetical protein